MPQKKTQYVRMAVALLVTLGFMAFLMRKNPMMPVILGSVVLSVSVIMALTTSRTAMSFVNKYPRAIRFSGIAVLVLVLPAALIITFVEFPKLQPDNMFASAGFLAILMLGSLLITLPRSAKYAVERWGEAAKAVPISPPKPTFRGIHEGISSNSFVFRNGGAFAIIAGLWAVLFVIAPLAVAQIVAYHIGEIGYLFEPLSVKASPAVAIAGLLAFGILNIFAIPIVAIAWHRFVSKGEYPRFGIALPTRGMFRYAFILWVFGSVVGTFDKMFLSNMPDLSKLVGQQFAGAVLDTGQDAFWIFAVWLFSGFALTLPAIALRDRNFDLYRAARAGALLGHSFRFGFLAALLPGFAVAFVLIGYLNHTLPDSVSVRLVYFIGPSLLIFMSVASAATYLSRAYQIATEKLPDSVLDASPSPIVAQ